MATLESCRERANRADEDSQSSLYYPRRRGEFRAKQSGRNLAMDPHAVDSLTKACYCFSLIP